MQSQFKFVSTALILTAGLAAGTAQAVSDCKSLAGENQCAADNSCRWVAGYQRKDGIAVRAHCRARPSAGKAGSAAVPAVDMTSGSTGSR